jgi:thiol-disulfide isomerase/thioredoxin
MAEIRLYYADWCGHCQTFKPVWEELKDKFDDIGVTYKEYESSKNKLEVDKANINGFPTIIMSKDKVDYKYEGGRSPNLIIETLEMLKNDEKDERLIPMQQLDNVQIMTGGNSDIDYKKKYLFWKKKYYNLKYNNQ